MGAGSGLKSLKVGGGATLAYSLVGTVVCSRKLWKINLCSDFRYFSLPTSSFMYLVVPRAKEHVLLLSRCKIFRNFYKGLCDIFSKTREASMSLFTLKLEGREHGNHGM